MSIKYLMGIDIGTYESKGVVTTTDGEVVASETVGHELSIPKPGWAEHDAEKVWWHDFVFLCRKMIEQSALDPSLIVGVGVSAISPCVLPIDKGGAPLRPGILYGIDTRASAEIEFLENELGKENIFATSGMHLSSQQTGPKILWLRNNEPEVYKNMAMILTASGFLVYRLTGEATLDLYTATGGYSPLVDGVKLAWSDKMAKPIVSLDKLPRLAWATEVVGYVNKVAAAETGLKQCTPVVAGTADAGSEAISVGLSQPGDLMIMYGSSIFFILKSERKLPTQRFWAANFLEPDTYVITGGMSTAGSITRWFRDEFSQIEKAEEDKGGENAYAALEKLAQKSPPGSRGLVTLPYFYGERTPIHDPGARGMIAGLTLNHTRADLYRSLIESIGFGIRHNIEELRREGVSSKRILAVGGGVKNTIWMQSVSDIIGLEQIIPDKKYGACYGDAFIAGIGIGLFKNSSEITEWISAEKTIRPNLNNKNIYDGLYKQYRKLYIQNQSTMHELSELQNTWLNN